MKALLVEQSLPICCSLAGLGGILEVAATAVTAVPAVREKEGITLKWWVQWLAIAGNVGLQALGSLLSHLIATWFGPVSIVVPFFYSATLLSNMLIFGLLGERFTKNMRVGTHVIVVAVILLPVVGPNIQEGQDISSLFRHWYSILWFTLLLTACGATGILLLVFDVTKYSMHVRTVILLVARAASISVNLTVSRAFIMGLDEMVLFTFIAIKLVSGAIYTYAIVVQSFAVEQARFVPLNATTIIIVNALTGIILWEDWRVVSSWYGYACIFVLLGLGCDLLLAVPLLTAENPEFGTGKRASIIGQQAASMISARRRPTIINTNTYDKARLRLFISNNPDYDSCSTKAMDGTPMDQTNYTSSRVDAWKELLSPIQQSVKYQGEDDDNDGHNGDKNSKDQEKDLKQLEQLENPKPIWHHHPVFRTPQKVGNAIKDTALQIAQQPIQLGGQIAKVVTTIVASEKGQGETSFSSLPLSSSTAQEEEEEWIPLPPVQQTRRQQLRLSRLEAWRETVSPIRLRQKPPSLIEDADVATKEQSTYELWQSADEPSSSSPFAPDNTV